MFTATFCLQAMDAIGEFVSKLRPLAPKVDKFVVGGASKRGWTTWTTVRYFPAQFPPF